MTAGMLTLCWLTLGPAGLPPDVYPMRDRHLQIPIRVNDARKGDLVELVLYVSTDQGKTWVGAGRAKPTQDAFNFHAKEDGLYWFSVQAVDRDGKYDPPDIAQVQPALKVIIDTQRALVQIVGAERVGDEVVVSWQTLDTQADINSLRLEYRAAGDPAATWQFVPATAALAGQARFKPTVSGPITVRLQLNDQAGVPATVTKDVPGAPPVLQQSNSVAPPPSIPPSSLATPPTGLGNTPIMSDPSAPAAAPPVAAPPPTAPIVPSTTNINANDGPSGLAPLPGFRTGEEPRKPAGTPPEFTPSATPTRTGLPEIQYIRDRQVGLEFEIDRKGPSGVKKIETYITQDDGQTWFRYGETYETISPLQLVLPDKEGVVYGFHIVAYSGVMQSEGPPKNGTLPDVRLMADRTAPVVEWYPPVPDANLPNALSLRFIVQDPNLSPNSVTLEWSRLPNSGWQNISPTNLHGVTAPGVPNLKECTWILPPDIPDAVYLRLTARDLAGNVGERITRDPVTVDLQKPTARVKRVVTTTTTTQFRP